MKERKELSNNKASDAKVVTALKLSFKKPKLWSDRFKPHKPFLELLNAPAGGRE